MSRVLSLIALALLLAFAAVEAGDAKKEPAKRTIEFFTKSLDKSLTPAKAVERFGKPDADLGSGLVIYAYQLDDGSRVLLGFPGFAPILYAKHEVKKGEVKDLPLK